MRRSVVALVLLAACTITPPAPPTPRSGTAVAASFGKSWDAVIDIFAERNIPIKTVDRASGIIVAEPQSVATRIDSLADCGTVIGRAIYPDRATWNVLVRGDSTRSTVKATVRFTQGGTPGDPQLVECSTRGIWETALEQGVKANAERKVSGAQ